MTALSTDKIEAMGVMCHFDRVTKDLPMERQLAIAECLLEDVIEEVMRLRRLDAELDETAERIVSNAFSRKKSCEEESQSVPTVDGTG